MRLIARILMVLPFLIPVPILTARAAVSYSVSPGIIRIVLPPGGSRAGVIKVYARSADRINVKCYAGDWKYSNTFDGARDFLPMGTMASSCADWISFGPAEFVIPPYEVGSVNYLLKAPEDAKGGYYAALFFETSMVAPVEMRTPTGEGVQARSTMNLRLAAVFYVEIKGTVERSIELGDFSMSKDPRRKRYLLEADFKNTGNADTVVSGTFHAMDKKGKIVGRGQFRDAYTMAADQARITGVLTGALEKGRYNVVATLGASADESDRKMVRGGVFTKEAEIEIGENGELVSAGEFK